MLTKLGRQNFVRAASAIARSVHMSRVFLLLIASTTGFNVPTSQRTTLTKPRADVRPARYLPDLRHYKAALATGPVKQSPVSTNAILLAMREEIVATAFACACIIFFSVPTSSPKVQEVLSATEHQEYLLAILAGVIITLYLSGVVYAVQSSVEAVTSMVAPSLIRAAAASPRPQYKEWLTGRPLPTTDELAEGCVLIASGPLGHWAMCSTPKDSTCEPDEVFSDYYGQPIYVCAL